MKNAHPKINVYSIWDNKTDELVLLDATAKSCGEFFGLTQNGFYQRVSSVKLGRSKRWHIESKKVYKSAIRT